MAEWPAERVCDHDLSIRSSVSNAVSVSRRRMAFLDIGLIQSCILCRRIESRSRPHGEVLTSIYTCCASRIFAFELGVLVKVTHRFAVLSEQNIAINYMLVKTTFFCLHFCRGYGSSFNGFDVFAPLPKVPISMR